jgi:hypothetical protein
MGAVKFCCLLTIVMTIVLSFGMLAVSLKVNYDIFKSQWNSENVCIAAHIRLGVERRDIVRLNGSCEVLRGDF